MSAKNSIQVEKLIQKDDILKKMLDKFSKKIIKDFLDYFVNHFNIPAAIWLFNDQSNIIQIQPSYSGKHLPSFCSYLRENKITTCSNIDRSGILSFKDLLDTERLYVESGYCLEKCSLGLTRILFPLYSEDEVIGVFIAGKFKLHNPEETNQIKTNVHIFFKNLGSPNSLSKQEDEVIQLINDIPTYSSNQIEELAASLRILVPLITFFSIHTSPKGEHLESILFLDRIETAFADYIVTEKSLWESTKTYLQMVIEKLPLNSAIVLYSDNDNFIAFYPKVLVPDRQISFDCLPLESKEEFLWVSSRTRGILLPKSEGPLSWINKSIINNIFLSDNAILYSNQLFDGKVLLIGFGFKNEVLLTDFEQLLLKKSALRLFKITNNALTSIETDNIMNETSHLLSRAVAKIESGFADIQEFGLQINDNDSPRIKKAKLLAVPSIRSGLFRLNLIERNFKAFKNLREAKLHLESNNFNEEMEYVDAIKFLNKCMTMFDYEMSKSSKTFRFKSEIIHWKLKTIPAFFELMILNLLDNAEKFSYRNTYIPITIRKVDNFGHLSITNLGVGIGKDEFGSVFRKYYQSIYKSPSKKRRGTGVGLAYCKQFIDLFYPDFQGIIKIESMPLKSRRSKFEGDNYVTTLTVILPIEN